MITFSVSVETRDEDGELVHGGVFAEGLTLREAWSVLRWHGRATFCENWPHIKERRPSWVEFDAGETIDYFERDLRSWYYLYIPPNITACSAVRVARLFMGV